MKIEKIVWAVEMTNGVKGETLGLPEDVEVPEDADIPEWLLSTYGFAVDSFSYRTPEGKVNVVRI